MIVPLVEVSTDDHVMYGESLGWMPSFGQYRESVGAVEFQGALRRAVVYGIVGSCDVGAAGELVHDGLAVNWRQVGDNCHAQSDAVVPVCYAVYDGAPVL